MLRRLKIIAILLLWTNHSLAQIDVFLSVVNKKGMDVGLSIVNEFHVIEEMFPGMKKNIAAGTDLRMELQVGFDPKFESQKPDKYVYFKGKVFNKKGTFKRELFQNQNFIPINQEKIIRIHLKDQHIEITLKPVLSK